MNRKFSLKKNRDIEKLIKAKKSVGNKFYAIYYSSSDKIYPQVAISPSKRFKNAVDRNYEKRIVKEILREALTELNELKLLIVVKTTVVDLSFNQKKEQIKYLINKIIKEKS